MKKVVAEPSNGNRYRACPSSALIENGAQPRKEQVFCGGTLLNTEGLGLERFYASHFAGCSMCA